MNVDETNWRAAKCGEYTWVKTGQESVTINSNVEEKSNFTMLAIIDVDGGFFSPIIIAKGQTEMVEANWFGNGKNIMIPLEDDEVLHNPFYKMPTSRFSDDKLKPLSSTDHSESGWTNQTIWMNYLYKLGFD